MKHNSTLLLLVAAFVSFISCSQEKAAPSVKESSNTSLEVELESSNSETSKRLLNYDAESFLVDYFLVSRFNPIDSTFELEVHFNDTASFTTDVKWLFDGVDITDQVYDEVLKSNPKDLVVWVNARNEVNSVQLRLADERPMSRVIYSREWYPIGARSSD